MLIGDGSSCGVQPVLLAVQSDDVSFVMVLLQPFCEGRASVLLETSLKRITMLLYFSGIWNIEKNV